jgi:aryl-alcohol dehydrogenase-like predicted oxidoreductase
MRDAGHRRTLGDTDLEVSLCGLGGNVFGGPRLNQSETTDVVNAALDLGVNFVDTANVYGNGESETYVGRALATRRDEMVIATKFNLHSYTGGSIADHVRQQAADSLRRLNTDRIDLYQLHRVRPDVDADDLMGSLQALIGEGMIRAAGTCNIASWRLGEWRRSAAERGWRGPATVQNYYHLLARQAEAEVLPYASEHGVGFLPYHPLAGGFLTGKYRRGDPRPEGTRGAAGSPIIDVMDTPAHHDKLDQLRTIAAREGRSLGQLSLAWISRRPAISSVIVGASDVEQLAANVTGCLWQLDDALVQEIEAVTAPTGVPSPERLPYRPGAIRPAAESKS